MANIVHFGKYYYPDLGGIESVSGSLVRGAVEFGHTVSVICFKGKSVADHESIDGASIFRAPVNMVVSSQPLSFSYVFYGYRAARKADVVHLHVPNMLGALCALFCGKKTRLLVHWHSDVVNKGFLGRIFQPMEVALLRRADAIVVATSVYAEASKLLTSFARKITVVPYGVSDPEYQSLNSDVRISFEDRLQGKNIILAVGRLIPYKGFDVLIRAVKYLPLNSVVVVVGMGPLENDLKVMIENEGVAGRVLLVGQMDDAELQLLFNRAALFCLPSTYKAEAFGMVLIEAMAYGVPVVACDIPGSGVPWVNQHGISGLNVPVDNPKELADACSQILKSEELRDRLSQGARCRFLTEFREDVFIARLMSVYGDILSHA
jgi:glycosyltransferase involved in cell wall biosynthesis